MGCAVNSRDPTGSLRIMKTLDFVEQETMRSDLPPFRVGDAVRVHVRVREGEKERPGIVFARLL